MYIYEKKKKEDTESPSARVTGGYEWTIKYECWELDSSSGGLVCALNW